MGRAMIHAGERENAKGPSYPHISRILLEGGKKRETAYLSICQGLLREIGAADIAVPTRIQILHEPASREHVFRSVGRWVVS